MKRSGIARVGVLLALLSLATVLSGAASGGPARANAKGVDPALAKQLRDEARGSVTISEKKATKAAGFVRAGINGDLAPGDRSGSATGKANGFLEKYGALVGATGESQLVQTKVSDDGLGGTTIRYQQVYDGVPVFGAQLVAHLDAANNLTSVNGVAVPDLSLSTAAGLTAAQAGAAAVEAVVNDPPADEETGVKAQLSQVTLSSSAELYVYKLGLVRGVDGSAQLAYRVEVGNGSDVREIVFVSASSGKVFNRYSAIPDALFRKLYELSPASTPVWQEGDPFPGTLNTEQQNLVNFSGHSYLFYFNAFGRDSYDGLGAIMRTVNNDPGISCPNANWNGATTNYCNGVTSDDVVAHEWSHAYTEYTHGLIYQWQPGALNEAYSDIFGETVDLLNGMQTDSPGAVRTVGACSTRTVAVPILLINSPTPGTCTAGAATFGPPLTTTGTTGDIVLGNDGIADPSTSNGCTPLVGVYTGKVVLLDRGVCTFTTKVKNAQNAGAIAAVIANNVGTSAIGLGGGDPTITIPSLGISLPNGNLLKGYIALGTTNVTLKTKGGAATPENSVRWLMGEDSQAFNPTAGAGNHAIRDMWDPTCLSDPGKVSDAEYQCDTSDAGGVHTNSGVPNHGYALLVDGGTYNGYTVTGLGLTKAAHLYFRAESVYQTPTTDFADHADALEQSCQDLLGQNLAGLSTSAPVGPSGQSITAADCAEVSDMIAAVELRLDPTAQCNFTPLLNAGEPAFCSNTKNPPTLYTEDFEDGLAGWTLTQQVVFAGATTVDWTADSSLPGGRAGTGAFAEDLDGQCNGAAQDKSSVMRMTSPPIHLPNSQTLNSHWVTFDHYIASEGGWDGGNVRISINGGAFMLVPASAFVFNPYNATMQTAAAGNTSPLAGEPGFTGTDGGQVAGTWGQSQIDLSVLGVQKGDTIQLQFSFGMDGCGAVDGWYVDDIKVRACNTKKEGATAAPAVGDAAYTRS